MSKMQQIVDLGGKGYTNNWIARSVGTSEAYVGRVLAPTLTGRDILVAADYWNFGYGTQQIALCMNRPEWQVANSLEDIRWWAKWERCSRVGPVTATQAEALS